MCWNDYKFPFGTNTMGRSEHDTKKHGLGTARPDGSVMPGPQLRPVVPVRVRHG